MVCRPMKVGPAAYSRVKLPLRLGWLPDPHVIDDQARRERARKEREGDAARIPLHLPREEAPVWPANADDAPHTDESGIDRPAKSPTFIQIDW